MNEQNIDKEIETSMERSKQRQEELEKLRAERSKLIEEYNKLIENQNANQEDPTLVSELIQETPNMNSGQSQSTGKKLSLNNGHSILGEEAKKSNGFVNTLILSLLIGFAGGALATAMYIFTTLGKVTVSL